MTAALKSVAMVGLLLVGAISVFPCPASADSLGLGGTLWTNGGTSTYLGWVRPIAGGHLGHGWFLRPWISYDTYRYQSGSSVINAHVPAISLGAGYAWSDQYGYESLSLAPGVQDTHLHPSDPANSHQGQQTLVRVQGQYSRYFAQDWSVALIANYAFGPKDFWSRLRVGYTLHQQVTVGPSVVYQGGPDYRGHQVGAYLNWQATSRLTLGVSAGYLKFSGVAAQGYAGLEGALLF